MPEAHPMTPVEIGMLRIYVRRADRTAPRERRSFWRPRPGRKPLYRELILRAKTAGLMNAVAHPAQYGYSDHGPVREDGVEVSDPQMTVCVELIGRRAQLEQFCRQQGDLLADKIVVYKHLERWCVGPAGITPANVPQHEAGYGS